MTGRIVWLFAAVALAAPPASAAATVHVPYSSVVYEAGPGEVNDLHVTSVTLHEDASADVTLQDAGAVLVPGQGCSAGSGGSVVCRTDGGSSTLMEVRLGDGDDRFSAAAVCAGYYVCAVVRGGAGDDSIVGSEAADDLRGQAGDDLLEGRRGETVGVEGWGDILDGGPGDDRLSGGAQGDLLLSGPGADVYSGGSGPDTVSYARRTQPVRADLDGAADDGVAGEGDRLLPDVEAIVGGRGDDRLAGGARANGLNGGGGDDVLFGLGGADWLMGERGSDRLYGGAGADHLVAGPYYAFRSISLREVPKGRDLMLGGSGNDGFEATDGTADRLRGGPGRDQASIDAGLDRGRGIERVRAGSLPRVVVRP